LIDHIEFLELPVNNHLQGKLHDLVMTDALKIKVHLLLVLLGLMEEELSHDKLMDQKRVSSIVPQLLSNLLY
jgi:hypothetical protein